MVPANTTSGRKSPYDLYISPSTKSVNCYSSVIAFCSNVVLLPKQSHKRKEILFYHTIFLSFVEKKNSLAQLCLFEKGRL